MSTVQAACLIILTVGVIIYLSNEKSSLAMSLILAGTGGLLGSASAKFLVAFIGAIS